MIGMNQTKPSPSPSPSGAYQKNSDGTWGGVSSGGSSPGRASRTSGIALGWGNDFAEQVAPPGGGWAPYITVGQTNLYGKTDAKNHSFLTDPSTGSYKRLMGYYGGLPAAGKSKWKSATSYWKWAVDVVASGPVSKPNALGFGGGVLQTPWDVMGAIAELPEGLQKELLKSLGGRSSGGGSGSGSQGGTFVDRQVNLTDAKTARRLVDSVYGALLGREATDAEARSYLKGLNKEERANPTVTTTTVSPGGRTKSSTVQGGTNAEQIAKESAQDKPEFDRYQAETTYLDAFYQALGSPGGM